MKRYTPDNTIITFDIHGVLCTTDYPRALSLIFNSKHVIRILSYLRSPSIIKMLIRLWHNHAVAGHYVQQLTQAKPELATYIPLLKRIANAQKPNNTVLNLVNQMKQRGFELHILSNIDATIFDELTKIHTTMFTHFDAVQSTQSSDKYGKPHSWIFTRYLSTHVPAGKQVIFIDNKKKNIIAAQKLGIIGIHYRNPRQLVRALKKLQILL
ncbi:MAG: HAD family hydrolase [Candidatus Babeliales bacterium]